MSGHSKWATTKHQKAVKDARRGKEFARLIKNIEVAARTGGGDPGGNPTLYDAIQKAKKTSVPNENIERARKRGAGEEAGGADWQTIMYEEMCIRDRLSTAKLRLATHFASGAVGSCSLAAKPGT